MRFTDEDLGAYVDGELPADRANAIADACANDAQLAARVRQLTESRDALRTAFAAKLDEPVPERLRALLAPAKVAPLTSRSRSRNWIPMALAASIALAVSVTLFWDLHRTSSSTVALNDDAVMQAHDRMLQEPLDRLASGEPQRINEVEIMPTASLIDGQGRYCREYEAQRGGQRLRGIACRDATRGWVTQVAKRDEGTAPAGAPDEYRPASGGGDDLAAALGSVKRMTPAEEQSAIEKRWGETKQ